MTYQNLLKLAAAKEQKNSNNKCENDIWKNIKKFGNNNSTSSEAPQYCILEGTCFKEESNGWNLAKFSAKESVIHALPKSEWMPGIHTPYMYFGMFGTVFPWHREDRNLLSINYMHNGREKLWYTIPHECAERFEIEIRNEIEKIPSSERSALNMNCNLIVRHKIVLAPPSFLKKHNIKFGKVSTG